MNTVLKSCALALGLAVIAPVPGAPPAETPGAAILGNLQPWKGDLDGMVERRVIRALVVPTRTQYWIERGRETGFEYEFFNAFQDQVNKHFKLANKHLPVR